ncbi:hypothetical protein FQN54_000759 [Arachnomyces sp. PD_36]|nr:hypothetical protein FQN54_000759 [Arachnomyces sp. PD_36]
MEQTATLGSSGGPDYPAPYEYKTPQPTVADIIKTNGGTRDPANGLSIDDLLAADKPYSTPVGQYLVQVLEECKKYTEFDRSEFTKIGKPSYPQSAAHKTVKERWVEQGIWRPEWEGMVDGIYVNTTRWKHEEPAPVEPVSEAERTRLRRERDVSRPYSQFVYQLSKERERIKAQRANDNKPESMGISTKAYKNIKAIWDEWQMWDFRWGMFPGDHWPHENCNGPSFDEEERKEREEHARRIFAPGPAPAPFGPDNYSQGSGQSRSPFASSSHNENQQANGQGPFASSSNNENQPNGQGLFASSSNNGNQQANSQGLFGSSSNGNPPSYGSLYGSSSSNGNQPNGQGLFASSSNNGNQQANGQGLFGSGSNNGNQSNGQGLFGLGSNNRNQQANGQGLFASSSNNESQQANGHHLFALCPNENKQANGKGLFASSSNGNPLGSSRLFVSRSNNGNQQANGQNLFSNGNQLDYGGRFASSSNSGNQQADIQSRALSMGSSPAPPNPNTVGNQGVHSNSKGLAMLNESLRAAIMNPNSTLFPSDDPFMAGLRKRLQQENAQPENSCGASEPFASNTSNGNQRSNNDGQVRTPFASSSNGNQQGNGLSSGGFGMSHNGNQQGDNRQSISLVGPNPNGNQQGNGLFMGLTGSSSKGNQQGNGLSMGLIGSSPNGNQQGNGLSVGGFGISHNGNQQGNGQTLSASKFDHGNQQGTGPFGNVSPAINVLAPSPNWNQQVNNGQPTGMSAQSPSGNQPGNGQTLSASKFNNGNQQGTGQGLSGSNFNNGNGGNAFAASNTLASNTTLGTHQGNTRSPNLFGHNSACPGAAGSVDDQPQPPDNRSEAPIQAQLCSGDQQSGSTRTTPLTPSEITDIVSRCAPGLLASTPSRPQSDGLQEQVPSPPNELSGVHPSPSAQAQAQPENQSKILSSADNPTIQIQTSGGTGSSLGTHPFVTAQPTGHSGAGISSTTHQGDFGASDSSVHNDSTRPIEEEPRANNDNEGESAGDQSADHVALGGLHQTTQDGRDNPTETTSADTPLGNFGAAGPVERQDPDAMEIVEATPQIDPDSSEDVELPYSPSPSQSPSPEHGKIVSRRSLRNIRSKIYNSLRPIHSSRISKSTDGRKSSSQQRLGVPQMKHNQESTPSPTQVITPKPSPQMQSMSLDSEQKQQTGVEEPNSPPPTDSTKFKAAYRKAMWKVTGGSSTVTPEKPQGVMKKRSGKNGRSKATRFYNLLR